MLNAAIFTAKIVQSYGISCLEAIIRYQIVRAARFVQAGEDFLMSTATLEGTSLATLRTGPSFYVFFGLRALAVWLMMALRASRFNMFH